MSDGGSAIGPRGSRRANPGRSCPAWPVPATP